MTNDMTDTELMLLAAKAAGIRLEWIGDTAFDCTNLKPGKPASKGKMWWPLVDDGDALRLAVKLRLTIRQDDPAASEAGIAAYQDGAPTVDGIGPWFWKEWLRDNKDDRSITTRRAIVRAAAEIGRAVQKPLAP